MNSYIINTNKNKIDFINSIDFTDLHCYRAFEDWFLIHIPIGTIFQTIDASFFIRTITKLFC